MKQFDLTNSSQEQQSRTAVKNSSQEQQSRTAVKNYVLLIMTFMMLPFFNEHILAQGSSLSITTNNQSVRDSNIILTQYCCERSINSLQITNTNDCCANFTIHNFCLDNDLGIKFKYEVYNYITKNYELSNVVNMMSSEESTIKICAINGESIIKYRIRIYDADGITPLSCADFPFGFTEGKNQKTGEVAVTCCPCPPNLNDYLTFEVIPGTCPNNGCLVRQQLNLPDSLASCFKYFVYDCSNPGFTSTPQELWDGRINTTLSSFEFCLKYGEYATITIYLLRSIDEPLENACKTEKRISCFEFPQPEKVLCKPDCFDDEWGEMDHTVFEIFNCPGCIARVSYTSRRACDKYQDLQIAKIEFLKEACNNCSIDLIYRELLGSVIALDKMRFEPEPSDVGCNTTWRIAQGGCWATWKYYQFDGTTIVDSVIVNEPCDSVDCCLQPMKVCRDPKGAVSISIDSSGSSLTSNCFGKTVISPEDGSNLECTPSCDWLANLDGEYPIKPEVKINFGKSTQEFNFDYSKAFGVNSNYSNNKLTVFIKSNENANAKINIFDLQGELIKTVSSNIGIGTNELQINTEALSSGIYLYSIEINGVRTQTNKLNIIK